MAWTPEKIKLLKKLWQKGKSTVEIGRELGMSKNAVVGKVHRLELSARPSPIKKQSNPNTEKKVVESDKKTVTLMDLKMNSCRWPIGELKDDDFHFCGKECQTGKPYCPEHCKIAYTSLKELTLQNAKNKRDRSTLTIVPLDDSDDDKTPTNQDETAQKTSNASTTAKPKTKQDTEKEEVIAENKKTAKTPSVTKSETKEKSGSSKQTSKKSAATKNKEK